MTSDHSYQSAFKNIIIRPLAPIAVKAYAERFKGRKPIPRWVVEARLVELATIPDPKKVDCRQAMVEYTYEVEKVLSGKLDEKTIRVAHWGFMDRVLVPRTTERKKGGTHRLTLELFSDHPQLEGGMSLLGRSEENLDKPLYHDVRD